MNDLYRGFEIEKRADGFYIIGDGAERGPFPRDDIAMDAVDAIFRSRSIDRTLAAKQEG